MKVSESIVRKLYITEVSGLDPITVFLEDYDNCQGKITVECFGEAWSHYWGSMGNNLIGFINSADVDYIAGKLFSSKLNKYTTDYEKISDELKEDIYDEASLLSNEDKIIDFYGEEWYHYLPTKTSNEFDYIYRITIAVKEAVKYLEG